jgi:hypothetical protein
MGERAPCPARSIEDIGGAYSMGLVAGVIWHTLKCVKLRPGRPVRLQQF